ncbi:MAG: amino acid adenylation domain-containing protein [Acidobacteriota bacterium]
MIEALLRQRGLDPASLPITPRSGDAGPAPLSFAQERLWILERFAPGRPTYNEAYEVRLTGRLDPAALGATLHELSRRHAALRTTFEAGGGTAVQRVGDAGLPMPVVDLSALPGGPRSAEADRRGREVAELPFGLERGPVARAALLRLGAEEHRLLLVLHHIVSDATSIEILVSELVAIERAFARGEPSPLPEPRLQYADFAQWQREKLASALEAQLADWKERLAGAPTVLTLPSDRPRSEQPRGRGASLSAALSRDLSDSVRELARTQGATLFMTLLSAFDALLHRHTGRQDFLVGTPIAGRTRAEVEGIVGFFVNTLVLRADLAGDPAFAEILARNRRSVLAAYDRQDAPFGRLVEELRPERSASHAPLVQVMFLLHKPGVPIEERDGLGLEMRRIETGTAKFDLTFVARDAAEGIVCGVEYDSDLFLPTTMARLLAHFRTILEAAAAEPSTRLSELPVLTAPERQQVLVEWNDAALARPRGACIHELFAARAAASPDAPALIFEGRTTSYGELDAQANRLARRLRGLGLRLDDLVGICLEPSPDLMVAVLGILKAGGAYVPLDPGQPAERLGWLLEDTGLRIVLTASALAGRLPHLPDTHARVLRVLRLDEEREALAALSPEAPEPWALPESLAYQIYTSGSTGRPKGVMVPHAGLVNLALSFAENWRLGPGDRMLMLLSLAFDASVGDLFPPLVSGATLVLHRNPQALLGRDLDLYLETQGVTCIELAAAFWQQWAEDLAARGQAPPSTLRTLVVGGESVTPDKIQTWYRLLAGRPFRLLNHYGPTEATVCASYFRIDEGGEDLGYARLPIGRPLANVRLHLLDFDLQAVPAGVPGELCIGGIGVARGYLGRPDVTAERFIPDPFAPAGEEGARLYRTGDLARHLPDGNLEFLGRVDHQVKIRGYRIEPGEIEAALAEHPAVREAAVLARADEPGPKRLVAYVAAASEPASDAASLRAFLKGKLPAHMVPEAFVVLDRLPLNANGKVDRKALPRPVFEAGGDGETVPPETELQRRIAEVWCELLQRGTVGLHDNFFDLGGNSLLLIRMEGMLRDALGALGRPVEVIDLFRHPTVAALAEHLEGAAATAAPPWTAPPAARPLGREIAIVGMTGRFPGASGVGELWRNLRDGVESIRVFTEEEMRAAGVSEELLADPFYIRAKGVLDDVEGFDAKFFGFSPREAEILDPQHRIFLECAWEALESSGYDPERHAGPIGVFTGVGRNSYFTSNLLRNPESVSRSGVIQTMLGNDRDFLPTRVSYKLNLKGPSLVVQTACSSSLVAVHLACRSLLEGECDMALAGGATVPVPQVTGYFHEEGGIFSNDGHCRAFDSKAKGTVPGSGVAIVALKRLEDALADGDQIHAVLKATAINNDGNVKIGYTAPSPEGQIRVIREAIARAAVEAESITYVETHGTGTLLGDLVEVTALKEAYRPLTRKTGFCALGSLKTNVGHMDTAAGVGGLIKATLALAHRQIPPSLHFREANPKLDMGGSPFYVNSALRDWTADGPLRAAVSSFGIGGTNAHAILEEAPAPRPTTPGRLWQLFTLSARSAHALDRAVQRLADHLESSPGLDPADVAYTLQVGRRSFEHRAAFVGQDSQEAVATLQGAGGLAQGFADGPEPQVVFLFPGSGSQRPGMASDLYRHEPVFRAALDRTLDLLLPLLGTDLRELLFPRPGAEAEAEARLRQPSLNNAFLFAFCHALAELWMSWGVRPQAMIGHSLGEYVAACIAGVLPLEAAVVLVAERGRLLDALPPGAMLSVPLPEAELAGLLGDELSLAAVNGPHFTVASGPVAAVDELERTLAARGLECRRIPIAFAGHSRMLDPMLDAFRRVVEGLPLQRPERPYVSTATGTWITGEEATDPQYWVRHLRQTVRFAEGMAELRREPGRIFLEVGPGKTLFSLLRGQEKAAGSPAFASLLGAAELGSDLAAMLRTLGGLWLHGVRPDWAGVHSGESRRRVALPTYPFEHQRFWIDALPETAVAAADPWQRRPDPGDWFWVSSWRRVPLGRRRPADPSGAFILLSGPDEPLADRLASLGGTVDRAASVQELESRDLASRHLVWLHPAGADAGADREALVGLAGLGDRLAKLSALTLVLSGAREVTGGEELRPGRAALAGAVRSLGERGLRARVLDLGPDVAVERVVEELLASPDDPEVAFRAAHRWVRGDERLRVDPEPEAGLLRPESSALLVGGDGEIRRLLENALGSTGVRLVLIDPSDLPAEASRLRERLGRPDAVIYAAGDGEDVGEEEARLAGLGLLAGELGAAAALAVVPLAGSGPRRDLAAAWIQEQGSPWRGAALENLPPARGEAWRPPAPAELTEALRRLASLELGSWVTVSTGDLPGRLAAWTAAASATEEAPAARPAASALHPRPSLDSPYVPPRNKVERDLVELWQDYLGIEKIGVLDNFFDLGGDSVTSIQIVSRANKAGYKLTQRKAFHHPTIEELARTALLDSRIHAQQSAVEGPVHLIPIQRWFFEQDFAHAHQWNISALLKAEPPLRPAPLEAAVRAVLEHHDALRLRFHRADGAWRQTSPAPGVGPGSFSCVDLGDLPEPARTAALEAAAADVQGSLDLTEGPLARFVLFRRAGDTGDTGDRLLAVLHHLVMDIPSWGILFEDLEAAYGQALRGEAPALPSKSSSYKHWAITLREHSRSGALDGEIPLWLDERRDRIDPLPVDLPGRNDSASSRTLTFTLPAEEAQILTQKVTRALRSDVQEILLTALGQALAWWTGGRRFLIDVEGLGREPLRDDVDLSRTVGWFTSSYPLLLELPETADPAVGLESVRDAMRAVPARGLGYGMLRYMAGLEDVAARLRAQPQPELAVVYLGQAADGPAEAGRFQPAPEAAGPARHPRGVRGRLLSLSVQTGREGLQLAVSYSENLHRRATIETLAQTFFSKLRRLAEAARAVEEGADPAALVPGTPARELPESGPLS